jgi:hypothetical protein
MQLRLITPGALVVRVNRVLAHRGQRLRLRSSAGRSLVGASYRVDLARNLIIDDHVDIATLARELGVLAEGEIVAADSSP